MCPAVLGFSFAVMGLITGAAAVFGPLAFASYGHSQAVINGNSGAVMLGGVTMLLILGNILM